MSNKDNIIMASPLTFASILIDITKVYNPSKIWRGDQFMFSFE